MSEAVRFFLGVVGSIVLFVALLECLVPQDAIHESIYHDGLGRFNASNETHDCFACNASAGTNNTPEDNSSPEMVLGPLAQGFTDVMT